MMEFEIFKERARRLVYGTFFAAEKAHKYAFKDDREKYDVIAGLHINNASSQLYALDAICAVNEDGQRQEFNDFINTFDTFKTEILNNISTGHSHQWTDIEFRRFATASYSLFGLLELDSSFLDEYIN